MSQWVALLRGINVGGNNKLPMADLREICERLWPDCKPRTYIASGNLVFDMSKDVSPDPAALISAIRETCKIDVSILILADAEFRAVLSACPFPDGLGNQVYANLCFAPVVVNPTKRDALLVAGEGLVQVGQTVWLHTPQGYSKSKLAEKLGQVLEHVSFTARNLNTMRKIAEMLDA